MIKAYQISSYIILNKYMYNGSRSHRSPKTDISTFIRPLKIFVKLPKQKKKLWGVEIS